MESDNRIDAFKVRRKIFAKYAEGSLERKTILKEAKMVEFKYASQAMQLLPKETFDIIAQTNQKIIIREAFTILFLSGIVTGLVSLQFTYFGGLTVFQTCGIAGAETYLTIEAIHAILRLKRVVEAFLLVKAEYQKMRDKMDKILTDMGGLA